MRSNGPAQCAVNEPAETMAVRRFELILVQADDDRPVQFAARRSAEHDTLGASREMPLEFAPRRLAVPKIDDRRDTQVAPGSLARAPPQEPRARCSR